jgi:tetratricopeptide (TPR) repeat protein
MGSGVVIGHTACHRATRGTSELDPSFFDSYLTLAASLFQLGRLDEAVDHLTTAVEIDPSHLRAHANRGRANYFNGSLEDAVTDFTAAITLDLGNYDLHFSRAAALIELGRVDEAVEDLLRARELNPGPELLAEIDRGLVRHHRRVPVFSRKVPHCARLHRVDGERFLAQHVLPSAQRRHHHLVVR